MRTRGSTARRGQALVEFALVLPILLLLILGIFEFGRAYNAYEVVTDAAREAARRAAVDTLTTQAQVASVAVAAMNRAGLGADNSMVYVSALGDTGTPDTVRIEYPFHFLFLGPLIGWTTGQGDVVLRSTSIMRQE